MDQYKAKLLARINEMLADKLRPNEKLEVVYWEIDKYGPRISEIAGHLDCGNGCMSGWSIMQCDPAGLPVLAAAERLLLAYEMVETHPDDGYANDVEIYEDMLRSLLRDEP